jgi:peptide/nickel transport system substrate-binding protein
MTASRETGSVGTLKVVGKALAVLDLFNEREPEWGASEVAKEIGTSVPTAHRILHVLAGAGYLTQRGRGRFGLGPAALSLGRRAQRSIDLGTLLRPELRDLALASGETAVLTRPAEEGEALTYAEVVESSAALHITPMLGAQVPLHSSGFGKSYLAFLPEEERMFLTSELPVNGPATVTQRAELERDLDVIRQAGMAVMMDESESGVWEVAAPIRASDGHPIGAIGVTGPMHPPARQPADSLGPIVASLAGRAESRIGAWQQGVRLRHLRHQLAPPGVQSSAGARQRQARREAVPSTPWGTFRIGHTVAIETLNPLRGINISTMKVFAAIYPLLVNQDGNAAICGDFATAWEISDGGHAITFSTHTGGRWTDGEPLTAYDAAFTLNLLRENFADAYRSLMTGVRRAVATDDHTLRIEYEMPTATALSNLSLIPILPQHYWEPLVSRCGDDLRSMGASGPLVTGGPFRVAHYEPSETVLLEAHRTAYGPSPHVERIAWIFYRSDERMAEDLRAGLIDAIDDLAGITAGFENLTDQRSIVSWRRPGTTLWTVGFNSNAEKRRHRELLDPRVREALAHALDRRRIVRETLRDMAQVSATIIAPSMAMWCNTELEPEAFDLRRSAELLDAAGYRIGKDGVRIAGEHPMRYTMQVSEDVPAYHHAFEIARANWREIGVEVVPEFLEAGPMNEAVTGPRGQYQSCDVFMWCWALMVFDPQSTLRVLTSDELGALNDTGFSDTEYDALYLTQAQETEPQARAATVKKMQAVIAEKRPYIPLCFLDHVGAYRAEWDGIGETPLGPFPASSKQPYLRAHRNSNG